ncbi:13521_t:CDS:2 [Ambispora leptoticha]|uniref:13521_t:CDS:1 n=1 Tax=Ambispora leptoticha TaxID=144679 RepID=A0A9N8WTW6_9GLOM|nr:13521_t:CDS:2 [Ambispora leptoticha]
MAGASAKRIAQENTKILKNLKHGFLLANAVYFFFRIIYHNNTFTLWIAIKYFVTLAISLFLWQQLRTHGLPRYSTYDGSVEWSGEDLNSEGLIAMFWEAAWWIYLVIPAYASYKLWASFIQPYLFSSSSENNDYSQSKRQQKKTLRQESGKGGGAKSKIKYR